MEKSFSESYKQAGVDITAGYRSVELMKADIKRTATGGEISGIGGFGERDRRSRDKAQNRLYP